LDSLDYFMCGAPLPWSAGFALRLKPRADATAGTALPAANRRESGINPPRPA
jgi:hypothetical protein